MALRKTVSYHAHALITLPPPRKRKKCKRLPTYKTTWKKEPGTLNCGRPWLAFDGWHSRASTSMDVWWTEDNAGRKKNYNKLQGRMGKNKTGRGHGVPPPAGGRRAAQAPLSSLSQRYCHAGTQAAHRENSRRSRHGAPSCKSGMGSLTPHASRLFTLHSYCLPSMKMTTKEEEGGMGRRRKKACWASAALPPPHTSSAFTSLKRGGQEGRERKEKAWEEEGRKHTPRL